MDTRKDMYGPFTNEVLLGRALAGKRAGVVIAARFGNRRGQDSSYLGGYPERGMQIVNL
jgi:aryl-alcohol dehydrogenase-like predicted oxidoreductase